MKRERAARQIRRNGIIRWYDPITGRWLSNDPIGISGGLNQYVFCRNNPVNFVDPFGLDYITIGPITICLGFEKGTPEAVKVAERAHEASHQADFWNLNMFRLPGWRIEQRGFIEQVRVLKESLADPSTSECDKKKIRSVLSIIEESEMFARIYTKEPLSENLIVRGTPSSHSNVNVPSMYFPNVIDKWTGALSIWLGF